MGRLKSVARKLKISIATTIKKILRTRHTKIWLLYNFSYFLRWCLLRVRLGRCDCDSTVLMAGTDCLLLLLCGSMLRWRGCVLLAAKSRLLGCVCLLWVNRLLRSLMDVGLYLNIMRLANIYKAEDLLVGRNKYNTCLVNYIKISNDETTTRFIFASTSSIATGGRSITLISPTRLYAWLCSTRFHCGTRPALGPKCSRSAGNRRATPSVWLVFAPIWPDSLLLVFGTTAASGHWWSLFSALCLFAFALWVFRRPVFQRCGYWFFSTVLPFYFLDFPFPSASAVLWLTP